MEGEQHSNIINSSKLIPGMPGWVRPGTLSDNSPTSQEELINPF